MGWFLSTTCHLIILIIFATYLLNPITDGRVMSWIQFLNTHKDMGNTKCIPIINEDSIKNQQHLLVRNSL